MGMEWVPAAVSFAGSLLAMAFGYAAFSRNKRHDDTQSGHQGGVILTEIGYIKSSVDDVKRNQEKAEEKSDKNHIETMTRLAKVEASAAQAHKRIDSMPGQNRG